jgi:multidrug efflux system outer membrane protein
VQRVRANLHASEARADAAQSNYQRTVLEAVEDIDNAVTAFNQQRVRVDYLIERGMHSKRAADLARTRYQGGATGFLELLDAERTQLAAEDDLAQAEAAINTRAVALYKALGGGWQACGDESCANLAAVP